MKVTLRMDNSTAKEVFMIPKVKSSIKVTSMKEPSTKKESYINASMKALYLRVTLKKAKLWEREKCLNKMENFEVKVPTRMETLYKVIFSSMINQPESLNMKATSKRVNTRAKVLSIPKKAK